MTLRIFRCGLLYNMATLAVLGIAGVAHAQSAASPAGGTTPTPPVEQPSVSADPGASELIVTAQRRSESIQNVGIAVTAFSGSQLKALNISNSIELAQLTPGLFISASSAGEDSQFTIRGVTQNDFNEVAESPIAVYVDDTYVPNLRGQALSLFDVQRVEVLKGPQGTLFGRNATGGLIQYVVNKPTDTYQGYGDITYGSYNQIKVEAAASGPIAANLYARASIYYDRYDPINTNHYPEGLVIGAGGANPGYAPFGDNLGNDNTVAGRLQVEYKPTSQLDIRLTGAAAYQNLSSSPYNEIPLTPTYDAQGNATNVVTGAKADAFGYVPLKGHDVSTDFARASGNLGHTYDSALHIDYDMGAIKFTSVSDAKLSQSSIETQVAPGPTNFLGIVQPQTTVSFSQEFRLTGTINQLNWTTGAYYLDRLTHSELSFTVNPQSLLAADFAPAAVTQGAFTSSFGRIRDYSFSLFGQGEYAINDQWKIIAGLRGVEEYQSFAYRSEAYLGKGNPYMPTETTPLFPLAAPYTNSRNEPLWTGKVQVEYRPVEKVLLYAEVNRGVKAGGYNQPSNLFPAVIAPSTFAYKPEELIDYEGGLKATKGIFTVDLSAFYYHYENYQAFRFEGLSGTVVNRPATYYGGEADITIRPMRDLTVELQASAVHARISDVNITPFITGVTQPTFTPQAQAGFLISYRFPTPVFGGTLDYGVEGHYSGSFYTDLRNFEGQRASGYFLANMHLIWTDASGHFDAAITANNIGDVLYETTAFDVSPVCGCGEIAYGNPRWITGRIGYKF